MMDIFVSNGKALVFNAEDACRLRRDHRIVGSLVGCLPRAPRQNCQPGLPLQLMNEEAQLLQEKGLARLVTYGTDTIHDEARRQVVVQFSKMREDQYRAQSDLSKEERRCKTIDMLDIIVKGKLKKLKTDGNQSPKVDKDEMLRMELQKIDDLTIPRDSVCVQLFTECPWPETRETRLAVWNFPVTDKEQVRYAVFKDLWELGNYITVGGKFGGDFLVYPGDPLMYHASNVAVCLTRDQTMSGHEMITKGRLGTVVKKNILFCSLIANRVSYLSLRWMKQ